MIGYRDQKRTGDLISQTVSASGQDPPLLTLPRKLRERIRNLLAPLEAERPRGLFPILQFMGLDVDENLLKGLKIGGWDKYDAFY